MFLQAPQQSIQVVGPAEANGLQQAWTMPLPGGAALPQGSVAMPAAVASASPSLGSVSIGFNPRRPSADQSLPIVNNGSKQASPAPTEGSAHDLNLAYKAGAFLRRQREKLKELERAEKAQVGDVQVDRTGSQQSPNSDPCHSQVSFGPSAFSGQSFAPTATAAATVEGLAQRAKQAEEACRRALEAEVTAPAALEQGTLGVSGSGSGLVGVSDFMPRFDATPVNSARSSNATSTTPKRVPGGGDGRRVHGGLAAAAPQGQRAAAGSSYSLSAYLASKATSVEPVQASRAVPHFEQFGAGWVEPMSARSGQQDVLAECMMLFRRVSGLQNALRERSATEGFGERVDALVRKLESSDCTASSPSREPCGDESMSMERAPGALAQEALRPTPAGAAPSGQAGALRAAREMHELLCTRMNVIEDMITAKVLESSSEAAAPLVVEPVRSAGGASHEAVCSQASSEISSARNSLRRRPLHTFGKLQNETEHWDLVVLGSSSIAIQAALEAANIGWKVFLIDPPRRPEARSSPDPSSWGSCDFSACWQHACSSVSVPELRGEGVPDDAIWSRVQALCAEFARRGVAQEADAILEAGVRRKEARATAISARAVLVRAPGTGHEVVSTDRVLVAVDSSTTTPPWVSKECDRRVFTAETLLSMAFLPRSVAVVGSGAAASEFAKLFRQLGAEVFLLEHQAELLEPKEREARLRSLRRLGVRTWAQTGTCRVVAQKGSERPLLELGGAAEEVDCVLLATHGPPQLQSLGLERLPLQWAQDGARLKLDRRFQTSVPGIFAAGALAGHLSTATSAGGDGHAHTVVSAMLAEAMAGVC